MSDMPTDQEIIRAVRLGRLAGRSGRPLLEACPYSKDQRVLRYRFAMGHAEATAVDWWDRAAEWLRRAWYGNEEGG